MFCLVILSVAPVESSASDIESPAIRYSRSTPDNVISRLQRRLERDDAPLAYDSELGYLPAVLKALEVPTSSQVLVYSRTSLQRSRIGPWRPRALYFNDDVYVGYCQGGEVLEISAADARLGTVFYTLNQTDRTTRPAFQREIDSCLLCHGSSRNHGFPGHLVRSFYTNSSGDPVYSMGSHTIDQTSPLKTRWGGWYVTGTHGDQIHLGNLVVRGQSHPERIDNTQGQNVTDLEHRFATDKYLTGHSDIVALMVLEHQYEMHNRIVRASFETRLALEGMPDDPSPAEAALPNELSLQRRIRVACDPLVEYLFFCNEARLTARVSGTSRFQQEFAERGPSDAAGRSLRDFDLEQRLFRYPLSYLVYSEAFAALPPAAAKYVDERVNAVLNGTETGETFAHLTADDRTQIRQILFATRDRLPTWWHALSPEEPAPGRH